MLGHQNVVQLDDECVYPFLMSFLCHFFLIASVFVLPLCKSDNGYITPSVTEHLLPCASSWLLAGDVVSC